MATYDERYLGLREGVVTVFEQLDGSARKDKLFYEQLSMATPISGDFDKATNQPVRTVINRRAMHPDQITPIPQKEWNDKILNYQKAGFTSTAHDTMVAGRHYTEGEYEASVVWPLVFEDHAWFNSLEDLENSLPLKSDKIEKIHLNLLVAKNVQWLKALTAKTVTRATRTTDSDLVTKRVDLPDSQYRTPIDGDTNSSINLKDISLLNALTKDMNGTRKLMLMSTIQWSHFYVLNYELFKNNDYVPGSDLSQLNTIRPFQGGITPIAIEETMSADGDVLFGLDESQIIIANPSCVSKCVWGGKTCDYAIDGHAYNQVQCWSREVVNYIRTSDLGVMIVTIPKLTPTLTVTNDSISEDAISATASETTYTITVTTNDNRLVPQSWHVETDSDWITVSPTSGSGSGTFTITVAENTDTSTRSGTVSVHSPTLVNSIGTLTYTFTVNQAAASS